MKFVGGLPCLDFVNTVGGWSRGRVLDDKIESYADLIRWAEQAGLGMGRSRGNSRAEAKVLARARALRLALYGLFDSILDKHRPDPKAFAVFAAELDLAHRHKRLVLGRGRFVWTWDDLDALDGILWKVSQSAADLLSSPDLDRVRRCAGEACGWLFLDTTRNHSRHWCDMKDCGNRAKVRRFRKRNAVR